MTPGWCIVWQGKSCVTYYTPNDDWSLDPDEARVFKTWAMARWVAPIALGVHVRRCWTDGS